MSLPTRGTSYDQDHTVFVYHFWLLSSHIMFSRSIHIVSCVRPLFSYGWVIFHCMDISLCLSTLPRMDIWVVSAFWLLWIMLWRTLGYKFLFESLLALLLYKQQGVELSDHKVSVFSFMKNTNRFSSKVFVTFYIPMNNVQESPLEQSLQTFVWSVLILVILGGVK